MLNSENVEIINSLSYFLNANNSSKNFSTSKPHGFSSFIVFVCFALFCLAEKRRYFIINNYS